MIRYAKTAQGIQVLQDRTIDLNARQRRLLVLIGTADFDILTPQLQQRFASPELIEGLCQLGLIQSTSSPREVTSPDEQPITEPLTHPLQGSEIQTRVIVDQKHECNPAIHTILIPQPHQVPISDIQDSFEDLTLAQVQGLMLDSLKKYCGLMAL